MVTIGKFCFNFSRVLGGVVDCVNVNSSVCTRLNHGLRDAQNVCALTKVGTVLKSVTMLVLKEVYSTAVEHREIPPTWSDKHVLEGHTVRAQCCDTTTLVKQGFRWLHNWRLAIS